MKTLTSILSLATVILSLGCTQQGKPFHPNAPDSRPPSAAPVSITDLPDSAKASNEAPAWQQQFNQSKDPLREVLVPLAAKVLDPQRVIDAKSMVSRSVQDELIAFNHLLLQTNAADRKRPEFAQILKQYESVLATDCGSFKDSCTGLRYLKTSSNSAQVVKLVAQNDSANYFHMLLFAIELKNRNWDNDLIAMLYSQPIPTLSAAEAKYQDAIRSMLSTALEMARDNNMSTEQTRTFLDTIHGWSLVGGGMQSFDSATQETLYSLIAQGRYMYAADGSLQPDFKKILAARTANSNGFAGRQQKLKSQNQFNPELIGAKYIANFDDLYFIVDSVFSKQLSPESGARLFGASSRSLAELKQAVENYVRIEFLFALYDSTISAQKIFKADVQTSDLLFYAIRQSAMVTSIWGDFTNQTVPLRNFSLLAEAERPTETQTAAELRSLFDSIPKSITLASVYPHELVLFHMLSQQLMNLPFPGGKTVNSGDLFKLLFSSQVKPLFPYTEGQATLNQFQIVYAFDMAVRTGLFQITNIDVDYFISDTIKRINATATEWIDTRLNRVQARFAQTTAYDEFKKACSELNGVKTHREFYFGELHVSPNYGELANSIYQTVASPDTKGGAIGKGSLAKADLGIFYLDNEYAEMVESARLDLGATLQLANAMLTSYKIVLQAQGIPAEQIVARTKLTTQVIADIEAKRNLVLKTGKQWYDDLGACYWKADKQDHLVMTEAIKMEEAYLRQVYRDIQKLRAHPGDGLLIRATQGKIQFSGLPSNFKGQDRISTDGYLYSQIDLQLRLAKYLTVGLTTDEGKLDPINSNLIMNYGNQLDVDVDLVRDSQQRFLTFTDSQEDFVNSGLRAIFNDKPAYLNWLGVPQNRLLNWEHFLTSLFALYRLEYDIRGQNTDFVPQMILDGQHELVDLVKMTDDERALYTVLHLTAKYDPSSLDHMILIADIENQRITDTSWGLFDYPVRLSQEEEYGYHLDSKSIDEAPTAETNLRLPLTEGGQAYYLARAASSRGSSVVPFNHALDLVLDQSVGQFIRSEIAATTNFQNATKNYLAAIPADNLPSADITMYTQITLLLTPTLIPSYYADISQFNQSTHQCYVSLQPCKDFQ